MSENIFLSLIRYQRTELVKWLYVKLYVYMRSLPNKIRAKVAQLCSDSERNDCRTLNVLILNAGIYGSPQTVCCFHLRRYNSCVFSEYSKLLGNIRRPRNNLRSQSRRSLPSYCPAPASTREKCPFEDSCRVVRRTQSFRSKYKLLDKSANHL